MDYHLICSGIALIDPLHLRNSQISSTFICTLFFVSAYNHGIFSFSLIHFVCSAQAAGSPEKQQDLHSRHAVLLFSPLYNFMGYHASFQCSTIRRPGSELILGQNCGMPVLLSSLGSLIPLIPRKLFLIFKLHFHKFPEVLKLNCLI